jgi:hypothetical protein
MPRPRPHLAKLTRPRLHNAVARERLFALRCVARDARRAPCVARRLLRPAAADAGRAPLAHPNRCV